MAALAVISISIGQHRAYAADATTVTAVTASAYGYFADVRLSGGPGRASGPAGTAGCDAASTTACSPSAKVPTTGGEQAATDPDGASTQYGAVAFDSSSMSASSQGSTGDAGSATSSASANDVVAGPLSAAVATSTCRASAAGVDASAAIVDGRLVTKTDPATGAPVRTEPIDPAPAAGKVYTGTLDHIGDRFKVVFNEQIRHRDGSTTVNAVHLYLLGPNAAGDLIVGQSVCGVSTAAASAEHSSSAAGTRSSPKVAAAAAAPGAGVDFPMAKLAAMPDVAAAALAPTAVAVPGAPPVSGSGAFGYFAEVSLFGGPATPKGPSPSVTLPAGGSATPITDSAPTGDARYGPGIIFTSGPITASTQGSGGSITSKVEIQNTNTSQQEVFTASRVASTCTGSTGSTTITGGNLRTSEGTQDAETDDTVVPIPASPPPNTTFEGKIEAVNDTFRFVFNEQIVSGGSITVNAFHMYLLGPSAKGDLIVGQSRCGASTSGGGAAAAGARAGSGAPAARGGATPARPGMATTGFDALGPLLLALTLLALGTLASVGGARLRPTDRMRHPPDAWS